MFQIATRGQHVKYPTRNILGACVSTWIMLSRSKPLEINGEWRNIYHVLKLFISSLVCSVVQRHTTGCLMRQFYTLFVFITYLRDCDFVSVSLSGVCLNVIMTSCLFNDFCVIIGLSNVSRMWQYQKLIINLNLTKNWSSLTCISRVQVFWNFCAEQHTGAAPLQDSLIW